jgi:antitoxin component YwqK of YwqJK toxin-antitoxin module
MSASDGVPETAYHPNGKIKFTGRRLDGEMHGAWEWHRTDGSLMRTGAFDQGGQIGVWRTIDRTGRVVKETEISTKGERS